MEEIFSPPVSDSCYRIVTLGIYCCRTERDRTQLGQRIISIRKNVTHFLPRIPANKTRHATNELLTYIIHSGFISGYQNRYGDNLKPPTNVYHRMTA